MQENLSQNESRANAASAAIPAELKAPPLLIDNLELGPVLDRYSIEEVVEFKISRFLDQVGSFYPENVHELIMTKIEKPLVSQILKRVGGNQVHASKILGINRNTLRKKMKIYGL